MSESQSSESASSTDPEDERLVYRVEESDGTNAGWDENQSAAEGMADECEKYSPKSGPHQVRKVPRKDVEADGRGTHPVVYRVEEEA